ncbi:hypothetical protein GLOIN_2v445237 [Rhizophagus irregularis DAOM 181602=DAOM 197198]|uniref:Uncharacterized protein n=1 Tax=Rhizophagus irregularis (strain DAOM 181602 / DAOM 197198 / MUCL 43194) TaxID=747089 RepID=A0A2P4PI05_RHIID|nr:hypothetical protein GLOIN_2v445237 [Rhizophagus irregularis DAOM 181602=DAOM 197198]POG65000.1 hypothetical protein GLOIN_2v445237 [Rhizophagus irregularis DAOM 181602=DAOM 197198]|eukprot:XP_025171866.1 hypothetical protein GLOIN_2v445237 [Rhizophagus irregularis DAOM 181602=DAOM 197198]
MYPLYNDVFDVFHQNHHHHHQFHQYNHHHHQFRHPQIYENDLIMIYVFSYIFQLLLTILLDFPNYLHNKYILDFPLYYQMVFLSLHILLLNLLEILILLV